MQTIENRQLPKVFYNRAVLLGITDLWIYYSFERGCGDFEVCTQSDCEVYEEEIKTFEQQVLDWAKSTFEIFPVSGDTYGENIYYDLIDKEIVVKRWSMKQHIDSEVNSALQFAK